jgi:hypothetical protein
MYAPLAPGLKTIDDALELATLRVLLFDAGAAIVANFGTKLVRVAGEMPAADPEDDHRADGEAGEHGVAEGPRVPSRSRGASRHSSAEPRRSRPCSRPGPELLDETGRDADREVDQEQGPEEMGQP